jgi:hypothetical protein
MTLPVVHFTVSSNPATFGDDDQVHVLALWVATAHLMVPPLAGR